MVVLVRVELVDDAGGTAALELAAARPTLVVDMLNQRQAVFRVEKDDTYREE